MSRLSEIFRKRSKCFIPFVTAGHPDLKTTREVVLALAESGADIVEIGIPFSDPIADGPIIQKSSFYALRHGHGFEDYLALVRDLRRKTDVGLVFMTYMNPVLSFGLDRLHREGAAAGLDGLLVSDLTPEEFARMGAPQTLDTVFLAAPTSSRARIERIASVCSGFLYVVARTGVTGSKSDVEDSVPATISRARRFTDLPIAVGFGISTRVDVQRVWQWADGAVVGSALVRFMEENLHEADLAARVARHVKEQILPGSRAE